MYPVLTALLLALAGFALLVVRRGRGRPMAPRAREHLEGFSTVGSASLAVLALAVVVVGTAVRLPQVAEILAMFGFFGFVAYVVVAYVLVRQARPDINDEGFAVRPGRRQRRR